MNVQALLAQVMALPPRVRLLGGAAIVAAVVLTIALSVMAHPPREALFAAPLSSDQLAEVQQQLAAWNVSFTPLKDNVVVDTSHRNDVLLRLSLAGIPHEHVATTNESLASVGVLTPQAVVDAQTRAGLAGDIELALRSVSGVDDARVIIAPAKTAEFADERASDATASVRLRLHPGAHLESDAVAGIRAFVAASVQGLDAKRVTVLDDSGIALSDTSAPNGDDIAHSLQTALDSVFGAGVSIVRVHIDADRQETQRRDVSRAPLGSAPISRQVDTEGYSGPDKHYQKNNETDDRGSDVRETVTQTPAGGVARMTAAVFVDASRHLDLAAVRTLAAATIGIDQRRGDTLTVSAIDFARGPAAGAVDASPWWMLYGLLVPSLPVVIAIGGVLLGLRWIVPAAGKVLAPFAERTRLAQATQAVSGYTPAHVRSALAAEPPHTAAAIISALPAATAAAVLDLYPQHERAAIVARMGRAQSSLIPNPDEVLAHA